MPVPSPPPTADRNDLSSLAWPATLDGSLDAGHDPGSTLLPFPGASLMHMDLPFPSLDGAPGPAAGPAPPPDSHTAFDASPPFGLAAAEHPAQAQPAPPPPRKNAPKRPKRVVRSSTSGFRYVYPAAHRGRSWFCKISVSEGNMPIRRGFPDPATAAAAADDIIVAERLLLHSGELRALNFPERHLPALQKMAEEGVPLGPHNGAALAAAGCTLPQVQAAALAEQAQAAARARTSGRPRNRSGSRSSNPGSPRPPKPRVVPKPCPSMTTRNKGSHTPGSTLLRVSGGVSAAHKDRSKPAASRDEEPPIVDPERLALALPSMDEDATLWGLLSDLRSSAQRATEALSSLFDEQDLELDHSGQTKGADGAAATWPVERSAQGGEALEGLEGATRGVIEGVRGLAGRGGVGGPCVQSAGGGGVDFGDPSGEGLAGAADGGDGGGRAGAAGLLTGMESLADDVKSCRAFLRAVTPSSNNDSGSPAGVVRAHP
ncbi:unnamed protein product [Pedinophyceae sp. YPF-701]|nr:unnamed protein product [Pedinophyceae sp. YPF-701]